MEEGWTIRDQQDSPAESFFSGVILKSPFMRELFSQLVDYEKVFVKWLLDPMLGCIAQ